MEVNTGAAVSVILDATQAKLFKLRQSKIILKTYTDEPIGRLSVKVQYGEQVQLWC